MAAAAAVIGIVVNGLTFKLVSLRILSNSFAASNLFALTVNFFE